MAAPVPLRSDFDADGLRGLAKGSRDSAQTHRLLALSLIAAGGTRSEAAEIGGVGLQTVPDWGLAFNVEGSDGLIDGKAPGARPRHHAQDPDAAAVFKKGFPDHLAQIAEAVGGKSVEVWFCDEARVSQKNTPTRRWAKRGTRPSAPKDQRTPSAYIFGAICPARGVGAGLVMPRCTTSAMAQHLEEIATTVAPGAHAVLLLDQVGWHTTKKLSVPDNITLLPLPARSPEMNPVENL